MLLDPFILLLLMAIMHSLKAIVVLYVFAQSFDVFVCDFIDVLKVYEGQLYSMFGDIDTSYSKDDL